MSDDSFVFKKNKIKCRVSSRRFDVKMYPLTHPGQRYSLEIVIYRTNYMSKKIIVI